MLKKNNNKKRGETTLCKAEVKIDVNLPMFQNEMSILTWFFSKRDDVEHINKEQE